MAVYPLLPPPTGLEKIGGRARLPRHRHDNGYVAIVLSGSYEESGDAGRFAACPGDALVHAPFEAHRDQASDAGAIVMNLPCPPEIKAMPHWRVADADAVAAIAADDVGEAVRLVAEAAEPCSAHYMDWPDLLAAKLRELASFNLLEWASEQGLAPESVSRGFKNAYGVTPHLYRAEARARQAIAAIRAGDRSLASVSADLGFSDQAHMTRAVRQLSGRTPGQWRRWSQ